MVIGAIIHKRKLIMANICLAFGTRTDVSVIQAALGTVEGLQAWWTEGTSGSAVEGGTLAFRFGGNGGFDMQVLQAGAGKVQWKCTSGPEEWLGTHIEFGIQAGEQQNRVIFRHTGWAAESSSFHHCSMKWATFLLSLRDYVEGGKGRPFPNDIRIEAA